MLTRAIQNFVGHPAARVHSFYAHPHPLWDRFNMLMQIKPGGFSIALTSLNLPKMMGLRGMRDRAP